MWLVCVWERVCMRDNVLFHNPFVYSNFMFHVFVSCTLVELVALLVMPINNSNLNLNLNILAQWNRKFVTAEWSTENTSCFNLFAYFFFNFVNPRVSTRVIASINNLCFLNRYLPISETVLEIYKIYIIFVHFSDEICSTIKQDRRWTPTNPRPP